MMMKYAYLRDYPAVFLKMTGLTMSEFEGLLRDVMPMYEQMDMSRLEQGRPQRQRAIGGGQSPELDGRDQILLTVIWLRQYPTQDVLGYFFGVSQPTVSRYIERVLPVLEQAGRDGMRMPDPGRKRRRHLDALLKDTPELIVVVDSFEQKIQRPKDATTRDAYYSGKKKTHTLKSQVAVDEDTGEIVEVAESVAGPQADLKLLEQSGLLARLPDGIGAGGDLAYVGLVKLHPLGISPRRKPRGKPRPPQDVAYNTAFSRRRIVVEHSIGRLRRYQSLTQPDRNHRQHHTARVTAVAGLANRQIRHRLIA
jgi:hypothetical protein